jgi:DNA primase
MNDTQTIKDRIDIVQFIQEYLPLKKSGVNWKSNCPFHQEKSPSFMVHPEKQIWHCFGCGKGGDVFSFLQEMEGLEFKEALKLLADRAGVKLEESNKHEVDKSVRNRLLQITSAAAYFFNRLLVEMPIGKAAREYLNTRGVQQKTLQTWQIGYIPEQWDLLTQYLFKKGYALNDLVSAGLTIKKEGVDNSTGRGYYDRFRGRIMFPICDSYGQVVGFTGRVLKEHEHSGGKYVNTPQTMLYDKSRVIYGVHHAKQAIKALDSVVLVEGQMDVISSHQAGLSNVVAVSGSS